MISRISVDRVNSYNSPSFRGQNNTLDKKQKGIVLASAGLGMTPVLAVLAKRKGFSLNPIKIFKTPVKNWAIFKYAPKDKAIDFGPTAIIAVATGSVAGGFVGGCAIDKSNVRAKKREVLNQILGNVLVPVACVGSGAKLYSKYADKIEGFMPQLKSNGKVAKVVNSCLKKLPNGLTTLGLLGVGIYLGNKVSNLINDKLYHKKVERNVRVSDFAPHVDDICMAASMMNSDSTFGAKLGRIIPLALLVPGYETGIAQNDIYTE